ncbi:hypothetical protein LJ656_07910 [Paraburkholderia sp. MMS20-SJTR3]|uniref:Uncharacterized protein n=1 Tax=Paraburkholderia sejongensis TaxID=2886946 RepID=A0ABS8JRI5_9BURK|nr:hypothetical protein [Paraburkholderia sp. MMS20-SJTR3]MCC8392511.1 hypothetical protein [Paraburkholderia sp. MMS20-SJTR3]
MLYQLLIVATLGGVRVIAPKQLTTASLIWTALTIFNLFWPPLIALQLIVIWTAYAIFKPGESASKQNAQPSSPPAAPAAPVKAAAAQSNTQAKSASAPAAMPGKSIFMPETIDPAVSLRPAAPPSTAGLVHQFAEFIETEEAAQRAASPLAQACGIEQMYIKYSLERASRHLKLERELASRGEEFRQQYRKNYDRVLGVLKEHNSEREVEHPASPFVCISLAQRPTDPNPSIDAVIQRKVNSAVDRHAQYLEELVLTLKKPRLKAIFEKEMVDGGYGEILKRFQRFEAGLD